MMKHLSENERMARNASFWSEVRAVKPCQKTDRASSTELSASSLNVLVKVALEPGIFLLAVYAALSMHPAEGRAAVNDLQARGMVKVHRLARKGRGGQPHVLEVLPPGRAELAKRGIAPAEQKVKRGRWLHDVYARYVERWARDQGFVVWFERTLGKKRSMWCLRMPSKISLGSRSTCRVRHPGLQSNRSKAQAWPV
jgi:hypothetical protein